MSKHRDGSKGAHRAGKAPTQRQLRVGEEIRHVLAALLSRGEFRDPELQNRAITVTEVRVSPDLRNATAFVVPLGGAQAPETMVALRRVAPYLRVLVGRELQLRHVPTLSFELDHTFDHAAHISRLLQSPIVRQDVAGDAAEDQPDAADGHGT
jgi:ribosome-binding factor A